MTHSVTLVSVYTHVALGLPFASLALDVRAGAPPGTDDWLDNSESAESQQWHDESDVLADEMLGDALSVLAHTSALRVSRVHQHPVRVARER